MTSRSTLALALAAALAGCAATGVPAPNGASPDIRVAAAWQAPLPPTTAPTRLDGWWVAFQDPTLVALIEAAQAASPTLASAAARIEQARAASVAAGAGMLPRVDAAAGVSRGRSDLASPVATLGTAGVQAAWEIDLFGAGRAARDAAQSRLAGSGFALQAARLALAAETGTLYTALRACEAQVQQAEIDAASRQETARVTDDGARVGFIAPATAALARASAAQARSQLTVQRAACDTQIKTLVALTALEEPALRERLQAGHARVPQAAAITPQGLPADLLMRRADLQDAARQVEAAAADERAAQAMRLPRVSLSGSIGGASVRSGGVSLDGTTWSLGPLQISVPLFDAGTRAAQAQAARAVYDEAVAAHRGRVREAVREVETALVALQATADREADARLATEGFAASFRATEARFKGGLASVFELEDARRTAVAARSALIDLQRERTTAWINLYRALGGGPDRADPAPPAAATR
jgi:NodT family efflux transporter outer membrane factor (OMF) lipoprotein